MNRVIRAAELWLKNLKEPSSEEIKEIGHLLKRFSQEDWDMYIGLISKGPYDEVDLTTNLGQDVGTVVL